MARPGRRGARRRGAPSAQLGRVPRRAPRVAPPRPLYLVASALLVWADVRDCSSSPGAVLEGWGQRLGGWHGRADLDRVQPGQVRAREGLGHRRAWRSWRSEAGVAAVGGHRFGGDSPGLWPSAPAPRWSGSPARPCSRAPTPGRGLASRLLVLASAVGRRSDSLAARRAPAARLLRRGYPAGESRPRRPATLALRHLPPTSSPGCGYGVALWLLARGPASRTRR